MRAILLGHSGFWAERQCDFSPPTYHMPHFNPDPNFSPAQDGYWSSYGMMVFDLIARSHDGTVACYMQRKDEPKTEENA